MQLPKWKESIDSIDDIVSISMGDFSLRLGYSEATSPLHRINMTGKYV